MKPITDEVIRSLIERAERRQRALSPANDTAPLTKGKAALANTKKSQVISLDFVRRSNRNKQTISGVFCYTPRTQP